MNKKADSVLHFVIFGVIAALGLFIFNITHLQESQEFRGQVVTDFLEQGYFAAEKEMIQASSIVKRKAQVLLKSLALSGGFFSTEKSPCGQFNQFLLWNKGEEECFPQVQEKYLEQLGTELKNEKFEFKELKVSRDLLSVFREKKRIVASQQVYEYAADFTINLSSSLEEYYLLESQAKKLLLDCRNYRSLIGCLELMKPTNWQYSCASETASENILETERKITFCVSGEKGLEYHFALDFTPNLPYVIEDLSVQKIATESYEISFVEDSEAEKYHLYYSPLEPQTFGTPDEVFFNLDYTKITINLPTEECSLTLEENKACLRSSEHKIVYFLVAPGIENHFFAVTAEKAGQESPILEFQTID